MKHTVNKIEYSLKNGINYVENIGHVLDDNLLKELQFIEERITQVAALKQTNKVGFRKIGSEITKSINDGLKTESKQLKIIRASENKRVIHKLIFEWLSDYSGEAIHILIYDQTFGPKLVDNTFVDWGSIKKAFLNINAICDFKFPWKINFIIVHGFSNSEIYESEKINNKQFYKIDRI